MASIYATITSHPDFTRVLIQDEGRDVLIARLPPIERAHRHALRTLLEALALFHEAPVHVVVFADDRFDWGRAGLLDALGFGRDTLHLRVDVVPHDGGRRAKRLGGLGSFARERTRLRIARGG
jgi:hypothetical protein